jgi:N6-adenosine-specific RNA methylase IME4
MTPLSDMPHGHYGCILADPPWAFRTYSNKNTTPHRCAEDHYTTMSFDELAALPVGDIAAKDCALFMWVVGSHLEESIALARAWGFTFKTDVLYWLKQRLLNADQIDLFTGDVPAPGSAWAIGRGSSWSRAGYSRAASRPG